MYSCCFVGCCFQDLFNIAHSILVQFPSTFFSMPFAASINFVQQKFLFTTTKKNNKNNRATPKRGNPSLKLGYLLNPPPGYTISNHLSNCSPMTPSSLLISVPQRQKSSLTTLTMPLFYSWQSMLVTQSIRINIAVTVRTSFLPALRLRTPGKDKLFYGDNKVSHYLIQIPDRCMCDNFPKRYILN